MTIIKIIPSSKQTFLRIPRRLKPSDGNVYREKLPRMLLLRIYFQVIEIDELITFANNYRKMVVNIMDHSLNYPTAIRREVIFNDSIVIGNLTLCLVCLLVTYMLTIVD